MRTGSLAIQASQSITHSSVFWLTCKSHSRTWVSQQATKSFSPQFPRTLTRLAPLLAVLVLNLLPTQEELINLAKWGLLPISQWVCKKELPHTAMETKIQRAEPYALPNKTVVEAVTILRGQKAAIQNPKSNLMKMECLLRNPNLPVSPNWSKSYLWISVLSQSKQPNRIKTNNSTQVPLQAMMKMLTKRTSKKRLKVNQKLKSQNLLLP